MSVDSLVGARGRTDRCGDAYLKYRSIRGVGCHSHLTTMSSGDFPHDEETETNAPEIIVTLTVSGHWLKKAAYSSSGYLWATVVHRYNGDSIFKDRSDGNGLTEVSVCDAVGDQVANHLLHSVRVKFNGSLPSRLMPQYCTWEGNMKLVQGLADDLVEINGARANSDALANSN